MLVCRRSTGCNSAAERLLEISSIYSLGAVFSAMCHGTAPRVAIASWHPQKRPLPFLAIGTFLCFSVSFKTGNSYQLLSYQSKFATRSFREISPLLQIRVAPSRTFHWYQTKHDTFTVPVLQRSDTQKAASARFRRNPTSRFGATCSSVHIAALLTSLSLRTRRRRCTTSTSRRKRRSAGSHSSGSR